MRAMTAAAASTYETIAVRREGAIAVIELQRPQALNAVTVTMGQELNAATDAIARDSAVRAVVLTGAGRGFSAGADLKGLGDIPLLPSGKPDLGHLLEEFYNPFVIRLRELPQPVVAAVNGIAAGIGCSFALACDHVIAARSSAFLLAFVNVALVPDGGASVLVSARAGMSRGLEMALLGEKVPAERALEWNLVNEVVDDEQVLPRALEVAGRLAAGPPEGLAAIKRLLNEPLLPLLREQLQREADAQRARSDSEEVVEAVSAFLDKRAPRYS
jgi:2-(1,2-epoxy-1,2-dihydrophenyl)acetyl-CoA isomerase